MNRRVIIFLLFSTLVIAVLFWLLSPPPESEAQAAKRKQISTLWKPEYGILSKDPRGLGFFNELLKTHVQDSVYILYDWEQLDSIPGHDSATYIFVGEAFGLDDTENDELMQYVDSGATVFYAFDHITQNLYDNYFEENAYMWEYSNKLYVALGDTSLVYYSVFQNDTIQADWYMFDKNAIRDTLYEAFAFAMDYPVAYQSKQHKGKTIMHSIPRMFCNYQVLQPNGFAHTEIMLRRIPKNRPVIWLEYGRRSLETDPYAGNDPSSDEDTGGNDKEDESYLQFILSKVSLRMAFLYGILVFLLYVLFRAKRRESIVPGIPEKRNMSLAFVETLSSIYLSRNSPYSIMLVLRKNFYMAINRHFYIDLLNTKTREDDIRRLIEKSSVDPEELRKTLAFLETNKPEKVNQQTLSEAYRYIRRFYVETGISRPSDQFVSGKQEVILHRSLIFGGGGLLIGLSTLIRGLYSLSMGSGYGILLVALALIMVYIAVRFFSTPVARITENTITVYKPFFGKNTLDLQSGVAYNTAKGITTLYNEHGAQVTIQHAMLSNSGKRALALFVEHIKLKTA